MSEVPLLELKPPVYMPMVGTVPLVIRDRPVMKPWYAQLPDHGWFVYGLLDCDEELIYVGMTSNVRSRLRQHSLRFGDAIAAHLRPVESELSALMVEATVIAIFNPSGNVSKGRIDLLPPAQWEAIERKRAAFGRGPLPMGYCPGRAP